MDVKDSPIEPDVQVTLGGKEYSLSFPIPAFWAFEDITGIDILSGGVTLDQLEGKNGRERTRNIAALCYAGVKSKCPDVTFEQVASCIFLDNIEQVTEAVTKAFFGSVPQGKKEATEAGPLAEPAQVV